MTYPGAINPLLIPGYAPVADEAAGAGHGAPSNAGGRPGPPLPPKGQPIIFPWWLYEMPQSVDWEVNALNFVAAASATTTVVDFSIVVPAAFVSVCSFVQFTVQNPTAVTFIKARFFIDDGPVQGWSNLAIPPLAATAFVQPFNGVVIRMSEGNRFTAKIVNDTAAAFTCSLQARGWHTPLKTVQQFMGGVAY